MKIAVIGTGYVGLVTGACFAENGNEVICVDNNQEKLALLREGQVPIYEPGLSDLVVKNSSNGRLVFTDDLEQAVRASEIIFFCLPTPPMEDGSADLQYVLQVASKIGDYFTDYKLLVNKSTVPVGTTTKIAQVVACNAKANFDMVSNPEFLREGTAVRDFLEPDRIIVGTGSKKAREVMQELYRPFVDVPEKIIFMDERSSETTKYAANSFLATKISFINEVANFCDAVGADVEMVRLGIGSDPRIGSQFLKAGIGYGGSCFPKDVVALHNSSKSAGYDFKLLEVVQNVNKLQRQILLQKVFNYFGDNFGGKSVAIWGLAFKPDTDDIRESPALTVIPELLAKGIQLRVYDPKAMEIVQKLYNFDLDYAVDMYTTLNGADLLLILTDWGDFKSPDFAKVAHLLKSKTIIDGRNMYDPVELRELGFQYISIGRPSVVGTF